MKEKTNNISTKGNVGSSLNVSSKDKEQNSMDNGGIKMSNMISPVKNEEKNNNEDKKESRKNSQKIIDESDSKTILIKSENNHAGRTQSYYFKKHLLIKMKLQILLYKEKCRKTITIKVKAIQLQ